tara:strand:+ start:1824 stop:2711 length:888 start_codon:yes stop_codon:yes gene_type:complete
MQFKRKATTAKSLKQSVANLSVNERWFYGTDKVPYDEYHKIENVVSASLLKDVANPLISDYHLYRKYIAKNLPFNETPAMLLGSLVHCMVLEPNKLDSRYVIEPKINKRTKQGKIDFEEFQLTLGRKTIIKPDMWEQAGQITSVVLKNSYVKQLMKDCQNEATGFMKLPDGSILKGRADSINLTGRYGLDLKVMLDSSPMGFTKASANLRYDIQAHAYQELFDLDEFIFIVVSKTDPIEVGIYSLSSEFMQKAKRDFDEAVGRWSELKLSNKWESYIKEDSPLTELAPPNWFKYI